MRTKFLLCTVMLTFAAATTTYAASYTAQTIKATAETVTDTVIETTKEKIITEDFSFKIPEGWAGHCVLLHNGDSLELYQKAAYEADGTGLLFTIEPYEDSGYLELSDYSIVGFLGSETYVLKHDYINTFEDTASAEYQSCQAAEKILKKSFVTFVTE